MIKEETKPTESLIHQCNANTFVKVDTQVEGKLPTDYLRGGEW